jgi:excisionase family DNA binding protein
MRHVIHPDMKQRLLAAIAAGDLTPSEVATYLGVHRMKVYRWLDEYEIDWSRARETYVLGAVAKWLAKPQVSKKQLRLRAERAKRIFDWRKATDEKAKPVDNCDTQDDQT